MAWALLLPVGEASGCSHARQERQLRRASRNLGRAVGRGDRAAVHAAVVPGARGLVDLDALAAGAQRRRWARALAHPRAARAEATVFVGPARTHDVVLTADGWRFSEDPTDVYSQRTPRSALRALVLASRQRRWDVLVRLAPKRYRMGLSPAELARAWTEGEHAQALNAARDRLAEHLADPIVSDAHEASLEISGQHVARLEREGDRWVVVDFMPQSD